jgi:hypothetical protein
VKLKVGLAIAAASLAAVPAAHGWSIHNYRVRDAGAVIVHKLTVCTNPPRGKEDRFHFLAYTEYEDGSDAGDARYREWFSRGCWRFTMRHDDLRYEGWYYGRVRVRHDFSNTVRWTGWRRFWSS